jgi:hypothetical protein
MKTRYGRNGLLLGSLGMLAFSGTLPATRLAVPAFGPTVLTCSRIVIAGLLGAAALLLVRGKRRPELRHVAGIAWSGPDWTGLGLAVDYPAWSLRPWPSASGVVLRQWIANQSVAPTLSFAHPNEPALPRFHVPRLHVPRFGAFQAA